MTQLDLFGLGAEHAQLEPELVAAFSRVLASGSFILGAEVEAFEHEVAACLGVEHAVAVSSGSDALVCALTALGCGPGHEVVLPAFSFFATPEAICRVGAKPRLPASFETRFARFSALPVWEPNRIVSGCVGAAAAGVAAAIAAAPRENSPAKKPLRYARCSGVNGALSGRTGM